MLKVLRPWHVPQVVVKSDMKVTCTWMPEWIGYLAEVEEGDTHLSRLLKSKEQLSQFIDECEKIIKERNQNNDGNLHKG